jgi:hypothetical protein
VKRFPAPPQWLAGLHLLVLSSFALAQPLFDLLGRNGEFFAARGSTRWDVVAFALLLSLLPPALLLAIEALTPRPARGAVHTIFVAGLVALLVLEGLRKGGGPGWLLVALAAVAGLAAAALYAGVSAARLVVTVLAPAPLLFLALFLFSSDASRLTLSGTGKAYAAAARAQAPAIVVVFDELPINSLLDRRGRIDPVRFPHFAALARGSTFFANNSVVSEGTLHGVPSLLTGRYPHPSELPVYHDHPRNLFTLLGGAAELHVAETETHLCPPKLCHDSGDSFAGRLASLFEDTGVVYLHELLPDDLAHRIPSVSNGWQDFWRNGPGGSDPEGSFQRFLATVRPAPRPALWYLHVLLPHSPWRFLPSGKRYEIRQAPGWSAAEVWTDNQAAVDQYWQRHLLQLGFTDRLLGRLLGRLRATGLYDRSLVVVTADEGLSFIAGEKRRPASEANLPDIAYVPLLVKLPRQRRGRVVRAATQSIDVLPTIAASLGIRLPWAVDGRNALSRHLRDRDVVVAKDHGKRFVVPAPELEARRERSLGRQLRLFGSGEPLGTLYGLGRYRGLLGRRLARLHVLAGPRLDLDAVDRGTDPVQVSGKIEDTGVHDVAIVSAGKIVAVVPVDEARFWALVPRAALDASGPRIYSIEGRTTLRRLSS